MNPFNSRQWLGLLFLLLPLTVFAQSNEILDRIYQSEQVSKDDGVWLILSAAEVLPEESLPDSLSNEPLTMGHMAVLMMENFDLPKGILFRITGSARYALKDLMYLKIVDDSVTVNQPVTSFELISALSLILEETGQ